MPIPLLALAISAFAIGTTEFVIMGLLPVWGIAAFATIPPLQMRVVEKAAAAPHLASTLNIGAFNLGNAGGAWLGGLVIERGYALDMLPWVAATVTAVALAVTWFAARMEIPSAAPQRV